MHALLVVCLPSRASNSATLTVVFFVLSPIMTRRQALLPWHEKLAGIPSFPAGYARCLLLSNQSCPSQVDERLIFALPAPSRWIA